MTEAETVENAEVLTRVFGEWPSFHDAEVLSMHLDRAADGGPSLTACIHVFLMTSEVDAHGYYVRTHHTRVTLRFVGILLRQLRWFNSQNSLWDLLVDEIDPEVNDGRRFHVHFGSNRGVEADLLCERVMVESVQPFDPAEASSEQSFGAAQPLTESP